MLYMAQKRPDGVMSVGEVMDGIFGGQPGSAEAFTSRCQCVVENEQERAVKLEQGWRPTPKEAYARLNAKDDSMSTAAAHRAFEDRNMSDAAKAEIAPIAQALRDRLGIGAPEARVRAPRTDPRKTLEAVTPHMPNTAKVLADASGLKLGIVSNALRSLERKGMVLRSGNVWSVA
jgi:hypothetical protein